MTDKTFIPDKSQQESEVEERREIAKGHQFKLQKLFATMQKQRSPRSPFTPSTPIQANKFRKANVEASPPSKKKLSFKTQSMLQFIPSKKQETTKTSLQKKRPSKQDKKASKATKNHSPSVKKKHLVELQILFCLFAETP